MRKNKLRAVAFFLAIILACSNTTPAMAALFTLDYDMAMSEQMDETVMGKYIKVPSLDELIPTQRKIVKSLSLTGGISSSSTSSDSDNPDDDLEENIPELSTNSNTLLFRSPVHVTIKSVEELSPYFPDANFRNAVFNAVKDGNDNAVGSDIEEALGNFTGEIKAAKKGITDARGMELLLKAELINLKHNEIEDWSFLYNSENQKYGYYSAEEGRFMNVTLDIGGNPYKTIPSKFGGRLIIKQMASTNYVYNDFQESFSMTRETADTYEGKLNIHKCNVYDKEMGESRPLKLISAAAQKEKFATALMEVSLMDDMQAKISNIVKSGSQLIGIGTDEEFHYETADEYDTITPGRVSAKYYVRAKVAVYDKVTVNSHPYKGSVVLVKTSAKDNTKRVVGAVYGLYNDGGSRIKEYTTDAQGQITVINLAPGTYYFQEIAAPKGYVLDTGKKEFQILEHATSISGGKTEVELSGGIVETAGDNQVFIAGPESYGNTPDIQLNRRVNDDMKMEVTINYSSLGATTGSKGDQVTRVFYNVKEAEADINKEKNNNKITGLVTVDVKYINTATGAIKISATNEGSPETPETPPKSETMVVKGNKTWVDEPGYTGYHPDLVIWLSQNDKPFRSLTLYDGQVVYEFHDLPKYDTSGNEYKYTVSESLADKSQDKNYIKTQNSNSFVNTYINGTTDIEGKKGWDDTDVEKLVHPTVTIILKQNGQRYKTYAISPTQEGYIFRDVPLSDANGNAYVYTVEEVGMDDWKSELQSNGRDFLNTYTPGHSGGGSGGGGGGNSPGGNNPPSSGGPGVKPPTDSPETTPPIEAPPTTLEAPGIPEVPTYHRNKMPDPEDPNSPKKIMVIDDEGVPHAYIKVKDTNGKFVYILEDRVPIALPKTGDSRSCVSFLIWVGSMSAVILVEGNRRRKLKNYNYLGRASSCMTEGHTRSIG